jgi:hypothetical protein
LREGTQSTAVFYGTDRESTPGRGLLLNRNELLGVFLTGTAMAKHHVVGPEDTKLRSEESRAPAGATLRLEQIAEELRRPDEDLKRLRALLMHWAAQDPAGLCERLTQRPNKG